MTLSMLDCHAEALDSLVAEESARLASAASVPHLTKEGRQVWWQSITARIQAGTVTAATAAATVVKRWSPVSLNGVQVSIADLAAKLGHAARDLGGRFDAERSRE